MEKWAEYGWVKAEPTSREEVKGLLTIVERDLKDATLEGLSEDRRFEAAFNAARTCANLALRASGYRTSTQVGHHLKTIESLELTIGADPKLIRRMKTLSQKRNATSYDTAGNVSTQELELGVKTGRELREAVLAWLRKTHPELLGEK